MTLSIDKIKEMKRYRHLIACMIDESCGYFTPLSALFAIRNHKEKTPYFCEWYMSEAGKILKYQLQRNPLRFESDEEERDIMRSINHTIIKRSLRWKRLPSHKGCLAIVDRNINGNPSIGASWF